MTRRRIAALPAILVFLASPAPASAQTMAVDILAGSAYNLPTPLTVRQDGYPDLRMTAQYDTKPFGPYAPYYSWRLSIWSRDRAWEVQHVHHRLFLSNTTPEIESFSIHYGYNYFLLGRAWRSRGFVLHASGGIVITSPASTIRGKSLNTGQVGVFDVGYDVSGAGGEFAISREWPVAKYAYFIAEGAVLAAAVSVPVADGSARVPNVSLHGHIGLGVKFPSPF